MLIANKNREVKQEQKVSCFFNLHKHVFSIESNIMERGKKRKLICAHGNNICLRNVTFKVNETGRQRVLQEKRKNVHAYVQGEFVGTDSWTLGMKEAYYNPYKQDCFTDKETGERLDHAEYVILLDKKIFYI